MANTQSSSPSHSPQQTRRHLPARPNTRTSVEQQLRLTVEVPQLLAALEILLPIDKPQYRSLSDPLAMNCASETAQSIKTEADALAMGIALADDALGRIKPCAQLLAFYFHRFQEISSPRQAVQL